MTARSAGGGWHGVRFGHANPIAGSQRFGHGRVHSPRGQIGQIGQIGQSQFHEVSGRVDHQQRGRSGMWVAAGQQQARPAPAAEQERVDDVERDAAPELARSSASARRKTHDECGERELQRDLRRQANTPRPPRPRASSGRPTAANAGNKASDAKPRDAPSTAPEGATPIDCAARRAGKPATNTAGMGPRARPGGTPSRGDVDRRIHGIAHIPRIPCPLALGGSHTEARARLRRVRGGPKATDCPHAMAEVLPSVAGRAG